MTLALVFILLTSPKAPLDLAGFTEDNLIDSSGSSVLPASIPFSGQAGTVVFGDEVVVNGGSYNGIGGFFPRGPKNAPANTVVVADTIRFTSPCSFDVSGGLGTGPNNAATELPGGTLTLIARNIIFDSGGGLSFTGFGQRGVPGTGKIRIVAKQVTLSLGKEEEAIDGVLENAPFDLVQGNGTTLSADKRNAIAKLIKGAAPSAQIEAHDLAILQSKSLWDDDLATLVLTSRREATRNSVRSMPWKSAISYGVVVTPVPPLPPGLPPGTPNRFDAAVAEYLDEIPLNAPELKTLMSAWKVRRLETMRLRLIELSANSDWPEFGNVASRLSSLESIGIVPAHAETAASTLQTIRGLIDAAPVAIRQNLDLEVASGIRQPVSTVTTMSDRAVYAIPDLLMLQPIQVGSTYYSGLVRQRQDTVEVLFSARFSLSSAKENALRKYLSRKKLTYGGLATQLSIRANPINFPGVSPASTMTISGNTCSGSLFLSSVNGINALAQLAGNGIPVTFGWSATSNGRSEAGTITGLTLSRSHVDLAALSILGGNIGHTLPASHPRRYIAVPSFAVLPNGDVAFFPDPKPAIAPGQSAPIPPTLGPLNPTSIPPEAILFDQGQDIEPSQAFRVLGENDLIHEIQIADQLPENDSLTNSHFSRLELRIANLDSNDQEVQVMFRTIGLREVLKVPVISNLVNPRIRISGAVYYLNGGHVDLKPWTATSALINITPDHLVAAAHP